MAEQKNKEPEGVGQEIETEGGEVRFEPVKKIEEDTFDDVNVDELLDLRFLSKQFK